MIMRWILLLPLLFIACQSAAPQPEPLARQTVLVGIGDSITSGFGASPGRSYFEQLQQRLKPSQALNLSRPSTTSPQHLADQLPRLPSFPREVYGIVVMTTGGNDLIHNYGRSRPRPDAMYGATFQQATPWIAEFSPRLDAMLNALDQKFPGGHTVFVGNIYDPTDGQGDIENAGLDLPPWPDAEKILGAYNQALASKAERPEVVLIDLRTLFHGHGIHHGRNPYWYYANLEDPNNEGYDAIAEAFESAIRLEVKQ